MSIPRYMGVYSIGQERSSSNRTIMEIGIVPCPIGEIETATSF